LEFKKGFVNKNFLLITIKWNYFFIEKITSLLILRNNYIEDEKVICKLNSIEFYGLGKWQSWKPVNPSNLAYYRRNH